jgi:hypothetical protein
VKFDPYKILGLIPPVDFDKVKRAYRKLAFKYHPDTSKEPNAEAKFKRVRKAYDALSELVLEVAELRHRYPRTKPRPQYKPPTAIGICPFGCRPAYLCIKCGAELCIHNVCMLRIKWVTATIVCSRCKEGLVL